MGRHRSTEKRCRRCNLYKSRDEFCKNPQNKDGLGSYCKPCSLEQACEWRQTKKGRVSVKRKNKKFRYSKKGKEYFKAQQKKYPERKNATDKIYQAIKSGKLIKPNNCQVNSRNCKGHIKGHHDDYDKPLDVEWFCKYHHNMVPW